MICNVKLIKMWQTKLSAVFTVFLTQYTFFYENVGWKLKNWQTVTDNETVTQGF